NKIIDKVESKNHLAHQSNLRPQKLSNKHISTIPQEAISNSSIPHSVAKHDKKIAPVNPATASRKEIDSDNLNAKEKATETASLQNIIKDTFPKISLLRRTIINPLNREVSVKVDTLMVGSMVAEFIQEQR